MCVCVCTFQHKVTPLCLVLCCSKKKKKKRKEKKIQVCSSAAVQQKKHCLWKHREGISYFNGRNITKYPLDLGKSDCCGFKMTLTELQNAFSPQMMVSRLVSCLSLSQCVRRSSSQPAREQETLQKFCTIPEYNTEINPNTISNSSIKQW